MAYATLAQLAAYLGVPVEDLPANASRLLERATELIDSATLARYRASTADPVVVERVVRATCAQAEYWISAGEDGDVMGGFKSYSAGAVSLTRADGATGSGSSIASRLAPRARDALFLSGLLNSGVNIRAGGVWDAGVNIAASSLDDE